MAGHGSAGINSRSEPAGKGQHRPFASAHCPRIAPSPGHRSPHSQRTEVLAQQADRALPLKGAGTAGVPVPAVCRCAGHSHGDPAARSPGGGGTLPVPQGRFRGRGRRTGQLQVLNPLLVSPWPAEVFGAAPAPLGWVPGERLGSAWIFPRRTLMTVGGDRGQVPSFRPGRRAGLLRARRRST